MKYCKKCGVELGENDKFCSSCGERIVDNIVDNNINSNDSNSVNSNVGNNDLIFSNETDENINIIDESNHNDENKLIGEKEMNSTIFENIENNNQKKYENKTKTEKGKSNLIGDIVRYSFGTFLVIGNITDLPNLSGIIGIFAGLSLMPFVFKLLKDKFNFGFKGISVIVPVVLIFVWVLSLPSVDNDIEESNDSNGITTNETIGTEDKGEISKAQQLQEKWDAYYKGNNISIVETNANTLYEYGKYYSGLTVLTSAVIEQKNSTNIKAKIQGQEGSIYYSFIFNFEDKKELSYYKKGDTVIIVGTVTNSNKSITLDECHIISSGAKASEKVKELQNNSEQHNNYAKTLKSELSKKGEIGNAYIEILGTKVINSRSDKILAVSLLYKNIGDENKEFNYTATVKVFQNGVELNSSIMKCSWYDEHYKDNADVEIQPGVSVTVNKCFLIDDTSSDVEVVVESWMFASLYDTLSATYKLK